MFARILLVFMIVLAVVIYLQPDEFRVSRSAVIAAPPAEVFNRVNELRQWEKWSPWAALDPEAKIDYEGPAAGTGSLYRWKGNHQVGEGSMTIVESRPNELVRMKLEFIKPFKGTNDVEFLFKPEAGGTGVTWSMWGKNNYLSKAISLVMNCEKMVGGQYEKGLAKLKSVAEAKA